MRKYKNIVLLSIMVFALILNSCSDARLSDDTTTTEQIDPQKFDYGDPSLYVPDMKYFVEEDFVVDFENSGYMITETFSNDNKIVNITNNNNENFILIDKNGKCLTEIYYNSIKYINQQYLECRLNLQDKYIYQIYPDKYITDILDINTGKVIKRFLNGSFSYYSEDLSHLNISYYYYIDTDGNYYHADDPIITEWLSRIEEDGSVSVVYVPNDYIKQEHIKRGYTDKDFNIVIPPVYDEIEPLDEKWQIFSFLIDGKYFIGDRNNNRLSEKYDGIFITWEDMPVIAFRDGKFCILSRNDYTEIIPPTYDLMDVFREGYAPVIVGGEAFYIDMTGNKVDIAEIPESVLRLFSWHYGNNMSALVETDANEKIKKYLEHMHYYLRGNINFTTTAENIFEDAFYNYVPALLRVSSEIAPYIIVRRETAYRFALDESYFTPDKKYRMAIYGYYRPVTNDYIFPATGLHSSYSIYYIVLDIEEKGGEIYEAKVLPVIMETEEGFSNPKGYFFGVNHTDENEEKYYLNELLPSDFLENNPEPDNTQIFYKLLDDDPELDILKQAYLKSPEKYRTLLMTFKITKGGLINLIKIN